MTTPALNNSVNTFSTAQVSFALDMKLAYIEREVILETLKRQNFNRTHAARVLGIGLRTLQRKLKRYGSEPQLKVPAAKSEVAKNEP